MSFKDFCCGLCAWFSVIGIGTFLTLAAMVANRNYPVIEHKFKMKVEGNDTALNAAHTNMIWMAIIMVIAAIGCFASSIHYAK